MSNHNKYNDTYDYDDDDGDDDDDDDDDGDDEACKSDCRKA